MSTTTQNTSIVNSPEHIEARMKIGEAYADKIGTVLNEAELDIAAENYIEAASKVVENTSCEESVSATISMLLHAKKGFVTPLVDLMTEEESKLMTAMFDIEDFKVSEKHSIILDDQKYSAIHEESFVPYRSILIGLLLGEHMSMKLKEGGIKSEVAKAIMDIEYLKAFDEAIEMFESGNIEESMNHALICTMNSQTPVNAMILDIMDRD